MVVEKIKLDLSLKMLPVTVKAKQGDRESRYIEASLFYNNLSYNVPATATVLISYLKPDKKKVENTVSQDNVIGNRVTFPLTEQMLTVAGISKCDVKIINDSGIISTVAFKVDVEPQAVPDDAVESTDEYNALIDALVEVRDAEDIRVSSEVDRVDNEVIREEIKVELESLQDDLNALITLATNTIATSNNARAAIEELNDLIKQAESLRKEQFETNESSRESQFTTNETSRANQFNNITSEYEDVVEGVKNEEINRQDQFEANEASRKEKFDHEYNALIDALVEVRDAEGERVANETDRVDAENNRVQAEQDRATTFEGYEDRVSTVEDELVTQKEDYANNVLRIKNLLTNSKEVTLSGYAINMGATWGTVDIYKDHVYYTRRTLEYPEGAPTDGATGGIASLAPDSIYFIWPKYSNITNSNIVTYTGKDKLNKPLYAYGTSELQGGMPIIYKDVVFIDLTTVFGAGNEPTKEEMDMLIDILGGWFDGEITLSQKQLAIWTLNMIRQNRNAIISLGGTIV